MDDLKMDEKRLRPKYLVSKIGATSTKEVMKSTDPDDVDSPFVLMPRSDPAAFVAMITYAQFCEPRLRAEIVEWLHKISDAPPSFGTQGARNWAAGRHRTVAEV